jgi:hypothetical protein
MLDAPHARFAGANGRAEFILAHPVRAKDSDACDHRPLCHVYESLNDAKWECKYHVFFIRRGMNLAGHHDLWYRWQGAL